ncbi:DUF3168 domain-containing protein [Pelomonas sp. V22]|uniref:DUF3168 domain-containing protein n=1 Tax=Pelomonas sp. V22 TaxID=2822139 RepID=UPI0024A85BA8|nr:DUF3168 domain-containing protein [Pelomonas sp. V22]MDI4633291.1 DUF3168 domain-containing protein [Pelomonas sp. V22]
MSVEAELTTLLKTVCPRVYPDVAPAGVARPYVTYSGIGGKPMRFLDNTAGDKRNTIMQVSVYSSTRAQTMDLIRAIEELLCGSATLVAMPMDEPYSTYEEDADPPIYGANQDFSIYTNR